MADINLIPPLRLARKRARRRLRLWIPVCAIYLSLLWGGLLAARILQTDEHALLDEERQATAQLIERHQARISELQTQLAEATRQMQVGQAICGQPDWSKLLVLLAGAMDDDVLLSQCGLVTTDAQAKGVVGNLEGWLSSSPLETLLATRKYRIKMAGFGRTQRSISRFVLGLEETGVFESVRLIKSNRQTFLDDQVIAFGIECWI